MLRILQQFCFWPVAESTYKSQNAQFGLVMIIVTQVRLCATQKCLCDCEISVVVYAPWRPYSVANYFAPLIHDSERLTTTLNVSNMSRFKN